MALVHEVPVRIRFGASSMNKARFSSEELCGLVEKEQAELWPEFLLSGYFVGRLETEAVVPVKAFGSKQQAIAVVKQDQSLFYFP